MADAKREPKEGTGQQRADATRLELVVQGIPVSSQAKDRDKVERWKQRVAQAARDVIKEEDELSEECRGILVFFYFRSTDLDVDNIIKPISDALCAIAYHDDRIVSEWIVRKTDLSQTEIVDPPPVLVEHLEEWVAARQPFVYVCVVDERPNHVELPK
ncbi:RusA family crossover junction endodeoxyribonuclease [Sorangium sp. So ce854]|uniref:RusA family crossover junction endodeoxyribonuclease n=1 Tax=Sorangium sp. So ce854 TaxID=3133322 RepID=UPI003F63128B